MVDQNEDQDTDLDENDLEDQESDDEQDDADDDKEGGEYKPPTKGEWERAQRRLKKYAADRKKPSGNGSAVNAALAAQLRGSKGKDDEDEDAGQDDGEATRWRGIAIQQAAAAQISAAGFTGNAKQAAKLARLMDTDGIEPDRSGAFDLEDEIEELKTEYPQLFSTTGDSRRRAPAVRRGETRETPKRTPTERTNDKLLRSAGFK